MVNGMSPERMKEEAELKAKLKDKNIGVVARQMIETREHLQKVQDEIVDVKRMLTNANQQIAELRGQINMLKMLGLKGEYSTASTVHMKDE